MHHVSTLSFSSMLVTAGYDEHSVLIMTFSTEYKSVKYICVLPSKIIHHTMTAILHKFNTSDTYYQLYCAVLPFDTQLDDGHSTEVQTHAGHSYEISIA